MRTAVEREAEYFFHTYKRLPLEIERGEGVTLITKDGKGNWSATPEAREVLERFEDPVSFSREADSRYYAWEEQRSRTTQRAWLIRGTSVLGANLVPSWLEDGFVSVPAAQLALFQGICNA